MAEDTLMLDQATAIAMAIDVDNNVPPVHRPIDSASAATSTSRNPLLARRNIFNPMEELRARSRETLTIHPSARVQKPSSSTSKTFFHKVYHTANERHERYMAIQRRNLRKQQVTRAIADGSFQIPRDTANDNDDLVYHPGGDGDDHHMQQQQEQEQIEQIRRLDEHLVAAALFEPIPGMSFDPTAPCAFTSDPAAMADLVQAVEAFQRHLARKDRVVLSDKAGGLLRGFARDVLGTVMTMLLPPQQRPGWITMPVPAGMYGAGAGAAGAGGVEHEFWACVAREYEVGKKLKWLYPRVMWADPAGKLMVGKAESLWDYVKMVLEAVERPGSHPDIIEVLGPAINDMPPFIVALPSTLQALLSHFETARARYLATLKTTDTPPAAVGNPAIHQENPATGGFGRLPRGGNDVGRYDSSDDEDDGTLRGGMLDGGAEDDGQVAGGVPSDLGQWFLVKLDKFTAFKNGEQQQGAVDGDMLSTLDLGGLGSNL